MERRDKTFVDPQQFTDEAAFNYASKVYFIWKKVINEVIGFIDGGIAEAKGIKQKEKEKEQGIVNPFDIGKQTTEEAEAIRKLDLEQQEESKRMEARK